MFHFAAGQRSAGTETPVLRAASHHQVHAVLRHSSIAFTSESPRSLQSWYCFALASISARSDSALSSGSRGSGGHGWRWFACTSGGGGGGVWLGGSALLSPVDMAHDVIAKAKVAQVRTRSSERRQRAGLLVEEAAVAFTVGLQLCSDGGHAVAGLLVGDVAVGGALAQLLRGLLEVGDGLAVRGALGLQLLVLRDGVLAGAPGIADPQAGAQRQQRRHRERDQHHVDRAAFAHPHGHQVVGRHQHTALPVQPAAR